MSSIGWVDFSEEERQRTLGVLKLLDEPGTLDSLGIGRIRDAFSDLLFPGTSTIQTRARYFLIVPWIYRELEERSPRRNPEADAENRERNLIERFNEARTNGAGDLDGLIGSMAGVEVRQLPSDIYWQGLHAWGIREKDGLKRTFMTELKLGRIDRRPRPEEEMESVHKSWWDRSLPPAPDDLLTEPSLALRPEEAGYLRETIAVNQAGTLLAHLVRSDQPLTQANLVWEIPKADLENLPESLARDLVHARRFSFLSHGANILYYLMLAEMRPEASDEADAHRESFAAWQRDVAESRDELLSWFGDESSRSDFWATAKRSNPSVPGPFEKQFVEDWFDLTVADQPGSPEARELLKSRELKLKAGRARLSNASAREYWTGSDQVSPLDYRWGTVQRHLRDIHTALSPAEGDSDA